jgi:hypothetical protein
LVCCIGPKYWELSQLGDREEKKGENRFMELFFLILLIALLLLFGYAQWQKGVVKTSGRMLNSYEEEEVEIRQ